MAERNMMAALSSYVAVIPAVLNMGHNMCNNLSCLFPSLELFLAGSQKKSESHSRIHLFSPNSFPGDAASRPRVATEIISLYHASLEFAMPRLRQRTVTVTFSLNSSSAQWRISDT
jgi:hypothetical protein